jgi:hypothetical protein
MSASALPGHPEVLALNSANASQAFVRKISICVSKPAVKMVIAAVDIAAGTRPIPIPLLLHAMGLKDLFLKDRPVRLIVSAQVVLALAPPRPGYSSAHGSAAVPVRVPTPKFVEWWIIPCAAMNYWVSAYSTSPT